MRRNACLAVKVVVTIQYFIVVTNLFLSFQALRLICFSVTGFKSLLPSYRFTLLLFLQDLTVPFNR